MRRWSTARVDSIPVTGSFLGLSSTRDIHNLLPLIGPMNLVFKELFEQTGGGGVESRDSSPSFATLGELLPHLLSKHLAQFNTELVEAVDTPDESLHTGTVLVQRKELANGVWGALVDHNHRRRAVAREGLMGDQRLRGSLFFELLRAFTVCEGIRLGEEVRHELVVVGDNLSDLCVVNGEVGLDETDEVHRHNTALMEELVEAVLPVGSWLSEVDFSSLERKLCAVNGNTLAVALHVHLLDVWGELEHALGIARDGTGGMALEGGVPHAKKTHEKREVFPGRSSEQVAVDRASTLQELLDGLESVVQRKRHDSDGRRHRVAAPDPVPEGEHVVDVDAEILDFVRGCTAGNHVQRHGLLTERIDDPLTQGSGVEHGLCSGEGLRDDDD
mmetsp:Transcript_9677/g.19002  ORF Transcript_9677/g.19002 Transcript_9677/m.19002 type:complete len:388 (-) Transcript_9677:686-1849(-)